MCEVCCTESFDATILAAAAALVQIRPLWTNAAARRSTRAAAWGQVEVGNEKKKKTQELT
jgi:hypothetical protein